MTLPTLDEARPAIAQAVEQRVAQHARQDAVEAEARVKLAAIAAKMQARRERGMAPPALQPVVPEKRDYRMARKIVAKADAPREQAPAGQKTRQGHGGFERSVPNGDLET